MLAITGSMHIWFIANVNDMRMGHRRLIEIVKDRFCFGQGVLGIPTVV